MSIRALADLAVDRDRSSPGSPVAQYTDVLTKAIPTESLAAYTAYIAVVQTVTSEQDQYMSARWWAFGGFVALTLVALVVAYYRKLKQARGSQQGEHPIGRWLPVTELAPAIFAASAWGLALPGGPLSTLLSGNQAVLTISAIIIGGGALVALTAAPARQATSEEAARDGDSAAPRDAAEEPVVHDSPSPPDSDRAPSIAAPVLAIPDDDRNSAPDRNGYSRSLVPVQPVVVFRRYCVARIPS